MALGLNGWVNEGQPVPDSNFSLESNSSVSQHTQAYRPGSNRLHIGELNARSVPFWRVTRYCSSVSWARHSSSVFLTARSGSGLPWLVKRITSIHLNMNNLHLKNLVDWLNKPSSHPFKHRAYKRLVFTQTYGVLMPELLATTGSCPETTPRQWVKITWTFFFESSGCQHSSVTHGLRIGK